MLELIKLANDRNVDIHITQRKGNNIIIRVTKQGYNYLHNYNIEISEKALKALNENHIRRSINRAIDKVEELAKADLPTR